VSAAYLGLVRRRLGLTQRALGVALGLSTDYIAKLERGERSVTVRTLLQLSALDASFPSEAPAA